MISYILSKIQSKLGIKDKSTIVSYFYLAIGLVVTSLVAILTSNLINQFLPPEELGLFSYNKSVLELAFGIISLNIYSSYIRFNLKGDNVFLKKFVRKVVLIASIILAIFIFYLTNSYFSLFFLFIIFYNERMYYFRSLLQIKQLNFVQILAAITTFLTIAINYYFKIIPFNSDMVIGGYGMGYLMSFLLVRAKPINIDESEVPLKNIFLLCLPAVGLVILDWVLNFSSTVFIKEYFSYKELANYAIAQRALIFIKFISGSFLMFYPMIYFRAMENKQKLKIDKSRNLILGVLLIMLIIFIFGAEYIYILLGASKYLSSNSLIIYKILLVAEFLRVASSFFGLYLTYSLKTITSLIILATGSIMNILLQFLFLKEYGIILSSVSTLVSSLIILLLMILFSYQKEKQFLNEKIVK